MLGKLSPGVPTAMPAIAYLNGRFLPIEEATVNIEDRGFQFGDSLYEVIRLYGGKPYRAPQHLARLYRGLKMIDLDPGLSPGELEGAVVELARRAAVSDAFVYIQITRGVMPRNHPIPQQRIQPNVILTCRPAERYPLEVRKNGVTAITHPDIRWQWCSIKATTLLANVLVRTKAVNGGHYDAILHEDGVITEGTVCNAFAVIDGVIRTHPLDGRILEGVSRGAALEVARAAGMAVEERAIGLDELARASEVFFTDTGCEVISVVQVDGRPVGDGKPGPVATALWNGVNEIIEKECGL